jgi:hypothetical protein
MNAKKINWMTATDAEKNACFAEHIAGWGKFGDMEYISKMAPGLKWETLHVHDKLPDWIHNANAVLPWLEKHEWWKTSDHLLWISDGPGDTIYVPYTTFPEAAMIALLRAKGVEVLT